MGDKLRVYLKGKCFEKSVVHVYMFNGDFCHSLFMGLCDLNITTTLDVMRVYLYSSQAN